MHFLCKCSRLSSESRLLHALLPACLLEPCTVERWRAQTAQHSCRCPDPATAAEARTATTHQLQTVMLHRCVGIWQLADVLGAGVLGAGVRLQGVAPAASGSMPHVIIISSSSINIISTPHWYHHLSVNLVLSLLLLQSPLLQLPRKVPLQLSFSACCCCCYTLQAPRLALQQRQLLLQVLWTLSMVMMRPLLLQDVMALPQAVMLAAWPTLKEACTAGFFHVAEWDCSARAVCSHSLVLQLLERSYTAELLLPQGRQHVRITCLIYILAQGIIITSSSG